MALWRCTNPRCAPRGKTALDFESDAELATCPACGIEAGDPRYAGVVGKLETIHFDPPDERMDGKGKGHIACNPRRRVAGLRVTGEPSVVNCKACRETDEYQKALAGPAPDGRASIETVLRAGGHPPAGHLPDHEIGPEAGCCG